MNIQIYGKRKCFDTKKAQRWFKERQIKFQYIDIERYGISKGELLSVKNYVGLETIINKSDQDYPLIQYLSSEEEKFQKLLEDQYLITTPIVRNGKKSTVGYQPDVWKLWD